MNVLVYVPGDGVERAWALAAPYVEKALRYARGEMSVHDVRELLDVGRFQLWIALNSETKEPLGAGITELVDFPQFKTCFLVLWASDAPRDEWLRLVGYVEQWARERGCSRVRLLGRKGWLKILKNYQPSYIVLEREI